MRRRNSRIGRALGVLTLTVLICVGVVSMASAQTDPYSNDDPVVKPSLITRDSAPEPDDDPGVLPFTGGDVTLFLLAGLGAVSGGALMVRRTRRAQGDA